MTSALARPELSALSRSPRFPSFAEALHTGGPAADRAGKIGLYGWLIGQWEMDAIVHGDDGTQHKGRGEIHFGWVLEGRAIQDVWILPGVFYGTTLRIYDPGIDAWHILWSDPLRQFYTRQIGRARGDDIVQEGRNDAGDLVRWSFTRHRGRTRSAGSANARATAAPPGICRRSSTRTASKVDLNSFPRSRRPMLDHVSIGVRDVARAKRFYDAVLEPLGYKCLSEGRRFARLWTRCGRPLDQCRRATGAGRRRSRACTSASRLRHARAWMPSTPRRCELAGVTTASPVCAPTTAPATTPPSRSIPTATGSRPTAATRGVTALPGTSGAAAR